jgi:hypothetical protein
VIDLDPRPLSEIPLTKVAIDGRTLSEITLPERIELARLVGAMESDPSGHGGSLIRHLLGAETLTEAEALLAMSCGGVA